MLYPAAGAGGSYLGMVLGLIDTSGLLNAFLFGIAGALGGMLVKYISKNWKQWKDSEESSK